MTSLTKNKISLALHSRNWLKFICLIFSVSCPLMANELALPKDLRPGSRTVHLFNHPNPGENPPETLELRLRKCVCKEPPSQEEALCSCWQDYSSADQPFVQGDARRVLAHQKKKRINNYFLGFRPGSDKDTNEQYIMLPSPEMLAKILAALAKIVNTPAWSSVALVPGGAPVGVDQYLELLRQKQIPLAKVALDSDMVDKSMLYHAYFHDLFNHVFFWIALPDQTKQMIADRVQTLIHVFESLNLVFVDDPMAKDLITIMKFISAAQFDTNMGTLNNQFLGITKSKFVLTRESRERYGMFINFGSHHPDDPLRTDSTLEDFIMTFFYAQKYHLSDHFKALFQNSQREMFSNYQAIAKDTQALAAFNNLANKTVISIEQSLEQIWLEVAKTVKREAPGKMETRLLSLEAIFIDIEMRYRDLFEEIAKYFPASKSSVNNL